MSKKHLVVTSISSPNDVLRELAVGSRENGYEFILIGDTKSPADFKLADCRFYDVEAQLATGLNYAKICPTRHYARKNIGYLLAMQEGAEYIIETDDDNFPMSAFWNERKMDARAGVPDGEGWINVYRYFSDGFIWPRGFLLNQLLQPTPILGTQIEKSCPVQQGLADENPDVDAIYRLTYSLPKKFKSGKPVALKNNQWCPFNSQNTTWFPQAYELMYLPAYCSFRMTDIWRSFIALRIMHENDWGLLFHEHTVWQERNEHNLMKDFEDEIPGYLNNERLVQRLANTRLKGGVEHNAENLQACYEALVAVDIFETKELELVQAWLDDNKNIENP